jgi:ribose transport system permease protein
MKSVTRALGLEREHLILLGLIAALFVFGLTQNESFGTGSNFSNLFEQSVPIALVSLGQTLVVLVGGVDLSVGALVSALSVALAGLCQAWPQYAPLFVACTLLAGIAVGLLNAALALLLRLHPLIVTIGMAAILNGLTLLVARQPTGSVPEWAGEIAYGQWLGISFAGVGMLLCFWAVRYWLRHTPQGLRLYAAGGNPAGARLAGIEPGKSLVIAFALSGLFAAAAAIYLTARTGTGDPLVGEPLTLASIAPVVIGGTLLGGGKGSVVGTLLGVLLLVMLGNVLNYMNVSTFVQWTVQGLIIIAAVFFQVSRKELAA